jgi:hypothetical protein
MKINFHNFVYAILPHILFMPITILLSLILVHTLYIPSGSYRFHCLLHNPKPSLFELLANPKVLKLKPLQFCLCFQFLVQRLFIPSGNYKFIEGT